MKPLTGALMLMAFLVTGCGALAPSASPAMSLDQRAAECVRSGGTWRTPEEVCEVSLPGLM
jgi:hypothetical protein